jgi:putative DNA methylase
VKSPNPAFAEVDVPLVSTFMLSTKAGKEAYFEPVIEGDGYRFTVKVGKPKNTGAAKNGTKLPGGSNFRCLLSDVPISADYIMAQGKAGRIGTRLLAVVAQGQRGRVYLPPTSDIEAAAREAEPEWKPDVEFFQQALGFRIGNYGMTRWSDIFSPRQLVALTTMCDLVQSARERVVSDSLEAGLPDDIEISAGVQNGARYYAAAISIFLAFAIDKHALYGNSLVPWYRQEDRPSMLFSQQVLSMVWDYVEVNPFSTIGGSLEKSLHIVAGALDGLPKAALPAEVTQVSATDRTDGCVAVISTDPPYYDIASSSRPSLICRLIKTLIDMRFSCLKVVGKCSVTGGPRALQGRLFFSKHSPSPLQGPNLGCCLSPSTPAPAATIGHPAQHRSLLSD